MLSMSLGELQPDPNSLHNEVVDTWFASYMQSCQSFSRSCVLLRVYFCLPSNSISNFQRELLIITARYHASESKIVDQGVPMHPLMRWMKGSGIMRGNRIQCGRLESQHNDPTSLSEGFPHSLKAR